MDREEDDEESEERGGDKVSLSDSFQEIFSLSLMGLKVSSYRILLLSRSSVVYNIILPI